MDLETSEVELPDQEWQQVLEAIDVIKQAGLDEGVLEIANRFLSQGLEYRIVFEIVCNDKSEILRHLSPRVLPQVGQIKVCDTRLPEEYREHEKRVPFPLVSLRLLYNEHPYTEGNRFDHKTLEPINPVVINEYDALTVKVTPTDTFIGGETVRMRPGKATEALSAEGRELVRFSNREITTRLNRDIPDRVGAVMAEVIDEFPPIPAS